MLQSWRLEFLGPDGRWTGPYCYSPTLRAWLARKAMNEEHINDPERQAAPPNELFVKNPGKDRYVSGTRDLKGLLYWFGDWLEEFRDEGACVNLYDVPEHAIGYHDQYQIVYQQRQAQPVCYDLRWW